MEKKKILVGLSGGVDSAVAAYLLQKQGHEVIAGFMINYSEPDNPHCSTRQDLKVAKEVADYLGIKSFLHFDFRTEYQQKIIDYIYTSYQQGITPNPDVFCNNLIKFELFLEEAIKLGCDAMATGHYAKITHQNGSLLLERADDTQKDQSYFLSRLNEHQLKHSLFPLGTLCKTEVRTIARERGLPNANRPDSQGLCFIGDIDMSSFLKKKLPQKKGDIVDKTGKKVGSHQGARFYTLGQRHQLFLPFKAYVTSINVHTNTLTIGSKEDEKLFTDTIKVREWMWTGGQDPQQTLEDCFVKIRSRQYPPLAAKAIGEGEDYTFTVPSTRGVVAGQILVAYHQNGQVIGSGIII